jgi:hypothetical protein
MGTHKSGSFLSFLPTMACSRGGQGFPETKRELADWARIKSPPSSPDTQQLTHPRAKCWCSTLSRVCGPHSFVAPRALASCIPKPEITPTELHLQMLPNLKPPDRTFGRFSPVVLWFFNFKRTSGPSWDTSYFVGGPKGVGLSPVLLIFKPFNFKFKSL